MSVIDMDNLANGYGGQGRGATKFPFIRKRSGELVPWDERRIATAICRAMMDEQFCTPDECTLNNPGWEAQKVAERVVVSMMRRYKDDYVPTIEEIQDSVEEALVTMDFPHTAKSFILFRHQRQEMREQAEQAERQVASPPMPALVENEDGSLRTFAIVQSRMDRMREKTEESSRFFPSPMAAFIYYRSYSRWMEEEGRRETWVETVDRYMDFMREKLRGALDADEYGEVRQSILIMEVMPSMRLMWAAGESARFNPAAAYNCTFVAPTHLHDLAEIMFLSMSGCGVGFSVEQETVECLPVIKRLSANYTVLPDVYVVPDSREGWCDALKVGLDTWFAGQDIQFDLSRIRPAGSRLRVTGGRSNGPDPLHRCLMFCRQKIQSRAGRRLRPIDLHDIICMIGDIANMGGVRRTALISLSSLHDEEMRRAKHGNFGDLYPYRFNANNSVAYDEKPTPDEFLTEWLALAGSGAGERGIFNREGARKLAPVRRDGSKIAGTNPCQPASATVLTPGGISTIGAVEVGSAIWSGQRWIYVTAKVYTGVKRVRRYETTAGCFIGTEDHQVFQGGERVKAKCADAIDTAKGPTLRNNELAAISLQDVVDGWIVGDGSTHMTSHHKVYLCVGEDDKDAIRGSDLRTYVVDWDSSIKKGAAMIMETTVKPHELPKLPERRVPGRFKFGSLSVMRGFLRGLYAANGSVCGRRTTLKSTSLDMIRDVQEMLSALGIPSYYSTNKPKAIEWENGTYTSRESYDLNISHGRGQFQELIGFVHAHKADKLAALVDGTGNSVYASSNPKCTYEVARVTDLGDEPVFDITVEAEEHSYWTGGMLVSNCAEILLRSKQFCNLSEVVARSTDSPADLARKIRVAAVIGTYQSTLTDFTYLSPEWRQNCEEERLLGVSITGMADCETVWEDGVLGELKKRAFAVNAQYADRLGIPHSRSITCCKPSGTVSQLTDASSGIHLRHAPFYIRRIRIAANDPLFQVMKDSGVPYFPETSQNAASAQTYVLEWPIASPSGSRTIKDCDAISQLERWKKVKREFTEHNPSCTISVGDEEWVEVAGWVYKNWDVVAGLSFLPYLSHGYKLAPYEVINVDQYRAMASRMPKVDFSKLAAYERSDQTSGSNELACMGGKCEL